MWAKKVLPTSIVFVILLFGFGAERNLSATPNLETLGQYLFFDKRLSFNQTKSCASCHDPRQAFTDGYRKSLGATADVHRRNSPTLLNLRKVPFFTAANPDLTRLEDQIRIPLFNAKFIELGADRDREGILKRLLADSRYSKMLEKLGVSLNWKLIPESLAAYVRSLLSMHSRYDRFQMTQDQGLLTSEELLGMELFFSERIGCANCHSGERFDTAKSGEHFFANGFTVLNEKDADTGLFEVTQEKGDLGKFRIPTLRNVALTSPYMHDGSIRTLKEVIETYMRGGKPHAKKSPEIKPFSLTNQEEHALLSFLHTLTDLSYLADARYQDPFEDTH